MQAKSCSEDRAQKLCVRRKPDTDSASDCNCAGMGNVRAWKLCGHIWLGIVRAAKMCLHNSPARTISSQNVPAHFACSHNSHVRTISSQNVPAQFACSHNSYARTISSQNVPAHFACSHNSHARTMCAAKMCLLDSPACTIHARTIPMLAHCSRGKRSRLRRYSRRMALLFNATQLVDSLIPVPFRTLALLHSYSSTSTLCLYRLTHLVSELG